MYVLYTRSHTKWYKEKVGKKIIEFTFTSKQFNQQTTPGTSTILSEKILLHKMNNVIKVNIL